VEANIHAPSKHAVGNPDFQAAQAVAMRHFFQT
jgi:hypothetical protein